MGLHFLVELGERSAAFGFIGRCGDSGGNGSCCEGGSAADVAGKIACELGTAHGWGEILLLGELSKQLGVHVFDS